MKTEAASCNLKKYEINNADKYASFTKINKI